jgi:outer membrane protein assembly factor BamD (BamD/ComL family)
MKKYFYILLIIFGFSSCSEYQKAIKSEDPTVKFDQASKLYEKGKYFKAITLFEQMAPSFRGKQEAEKMFYMFSQSYYKTKQYYLSGYQFESFAAGYPKSDKIEEASFLGKHTVVLRASTERTHIPKEYITILEDYSLLDKIYEIIPKNHLSPCNVYGYGESSKKIIDIINSHQNNKHS